MDYLFNPHRAERHTTFANKGMVATSQPLAAQAGIDMLKKGGNAVDAAIATAATLAVVEPTSNGIGSDAFALIWDTERLHGLNASGPAPASISIEAVRKMGYDKMPIHGVLPITVPGAPKAWAALSEKFGTLPFETLLQPAIQYASEGFAISSVLGKHWALDYHYYKEQLQGDVFQHWFDTFAPNGRAPRIGERWKCEAQAETLRQIAKTKGDALYGGALAQQIDTFMQQHGGFLTKRDLAQYDVEWVEPISTTYNGYDVWEIPPNGHGIVALMALNIYRERQTRALSDVERLHEQIESMKLAFTDGQAYIAEPEHMPIAFRELLSKQYATRRAALITDEAIDPQPIDLPNGGTVYIATADESGMMVSFIQSTYMRFGSGVVIPNTGIALQNRGADFSLHPDAPNALRPQRRSYHTIIPGFLTKGKEAVGPFGVMGGYMQPQGHMQVLLHTIDDALHPQSALDAPRWQWVGGKKIIVEPNFPSHLVQALIRKGHDVEVMADSSLFGRGQIIWRDAKHQTYAGGTESRTDGSIAVW